MQRCVCDVVPASKLLINILAALARGSQTTAEPSRSPVGYRSAALDIHQHSAAVDSLAIGLFVRSCIGYISIGIARTHTRAALLSLRSRTLHVTLSLKLDEAVSTRFASLIANDVNVSDGAVDLELIQQALLGRAVTLCVCARPQQGHVSTKEPTKQPTNQARVVHTRVYHSRDEQRLVRIFGMPFALALRVPLGEFSLDDLIGESALGGGDALLALLLGLVVVVLGRYDRARRLKVRQNLADAAQRRRLLLDQRRQVFERRSWREERQ